MIRHKIDSQSDLLRLFDKLPHHYKLYTDRFNQTTTNQHSKNF